MTSLIVLIQKNQFQCKFGLYIQPKYTYTSFFSVQDLIMYCVICGLNRYLFTHNHFVIIQQKKRKK